MLGDILGNKAGDTWEELILALFMALRGASCGVFRRFGVVVVDELAASWGLWLADAVVLARANPGDGNGWNAGVLDDADSVFGDRSCGDFVCVIKGVTSDFCAVPELTGSGSSNFSMTSAAMGSGPAATSGLSALLGEGSFIRDAGVAGEGFPVR